MTSFLSASRPPLFAILALIALTAVACTSARPADEPTESPKPGDAASAPANATTQPADSPTATVATTTQSPDVVPLPTAQLLKAATNRIAFTSADGSIYTISPDGTDRQRVTIGDPTLNNRAFAAFYAWPSWSPDGRHLLVTAFTPDFSGGFETSLLRTPAESPGALPLLIYRDLPGTTGIGGIPHFPVWHPDGGSVALIANTGDGLTTFLIDVEDGIGAIVSNGAPVYLDWARDGAHLLVHTAERLVIHEFDAAGDRTGSQQVGSGSIAYRAPKFSPVSDQFVYVDVIDDVRSLYIGSPTSPGEPIRPARVSNAFAWSPDGSSLAFADSNRGGFYERLRIIDPDGSAAEDVVVDTPVLAFWWSPDGTRILLALPGGEPENAALAVVDATTGDVELLGLIEPSAEMGFVIGFFDQYAPDLRLWSPDSSRVVFSGILKDGLADPGAGTTVQLGDATSSVWVLDPSGIEAPLSMGAGSFGTWSPE